MLTKEIYWQLELLQLLDQQDDWCSGVELAQACGLNVNTVQKYIDHLRELTKKFTDVHLDKHRNYGIRLIREPAFPLHRLLREVIRQGILVPFLEELLRFGSVDPQVFCEQHFISLSTLRRNISKLEQELAPLGLSLMKGPTIHLAGPELQIRYLFFQYLWTIYRGVKELPWEIESQMKYPIEQLADLFDYSFTNIQRSQLAVLLFVFEQRNNIQSVQNVSARPNFKAPSLFCHWKSNDWSTLMFFLHIFPLFSELAETSVLVELPSNMKLIVEDQSNDWIELFEKNFSEKISNRKSTRTKLQRLFLFNQSLTEVHSLTGLFPIVDDQHLKLIVPHYVEIFSVFIGEFLSKVEVRNPKVTELFSLLLANTLIPYVNYRPIAKLFLLSDLGSSFEQMQKDLLTADLNDEFRVEFVETAEEADLTLSNMPTHYTKSLQVRSTINSRDLRLIRQELRSRNS